MSARPSWASARRFAYPVIQLAAERHDPAAPAFAIGAILGISRLLAVPMAAVVGITGAYQAIDGPWSLRRDAWLGAGIVLYPAAYGVALAFLTPMRCWCCCSACCSPTGS